MSDPIPQTTRQVRLRAVPAGRPVAEDFELVEQAVDALPEGGVLVAVRMLGMDPYLRIRLRGAPMFQGGPVMGGPVQVGAVIPGRGVGIVLASDAEGFAPGDRVAGELAWQDVVVADPAALMRLPPGDTPDALHLGPLGPTGLAAYFAALRDPVTPGQVAVISAASGAVGILAGQLLKSEGVRVVGIAGGAEKTALLTGRAGFDAAADYRAGDFAEQLAAALPEGADLFLDLTGGAVHDAVMARLNPGARVELVGVTASYGAAGDADGSHSHLYQMIMKRITMRGFFVGDHRDAFPEAMADLAQRIADGRLRAFDRVHDGLEQAPAAFAGLFDSSGVGKTLVRVGR